MSNEFVENIEKFMKASGHLPIEKSFDIRQTALQIGLQLEEMAEKLEAIGLDGETYERMVELSAAMKSGIYDSFVRDGDRAAMLDADIDLAWVTVGSALSQGADVLGAMKEVARANLSKIGPDGTVLKDENGKVKKPDGFTPPDITPFVLPV